MKKLLLADPDPVNSHVLETVLISEGYRIFRVQTTEEWNWMTREKSFHLIVMDESFLSLSRDLFAISQDAFHTLERTPMIIMTEYPELTEYRYKFPNRARFLLKPVQADEMFRLVRQVFFEREERNRQITLAASSAELP